MPRNRPGALRAAGHALAALPREIPPPLPVRGLSARTSLAIHRVEHGPGGYLLFSGATERALHRYRTFVQTPGRGPLYPRTAVCPACPGCGLDDVRHARDVLEETLRLLPRRARSELGRAVRALDDRYRSRTLPDPRPQPGPWWHRRLADGAEGW